MATEPVKPKKKVYIQKPIQLVRTATDLQRIKLEKLMQHPDRMVVIPEPPKEKSLPPPPEFNRNVMGSSAGAGSGEFHLYRHLRRREYARQKLIAESADKETKDTDYRQKILENMEIADARTAKKRKKRLRRKLKVKLKKLNTDSKQKEKGETTNEKGDVANEEDKNENDSSDDDSKEDDSDQKD